MKTPSLIAPAALLLLAACGSADAAQRGEAASPPRVQKQRQAPPPARVVPARLSLEEIEDARWREANEESPKSLLPDASPVAETVAEETVELRIYRARPPEPPAAAEAAPAEPGGAAKAEAEPAAAADAADKKADQPEPQ